MGNEVAGGNPSVYRLRHDTEHLGELGDGVEPHRAMLLHVHEQGSFGSPTAIVPAFGADDAAIQSRAAWRASRRARAMRAACRRLGGGDESVSSPRFFAVT